ncbi:FHA domain-containing serine/threonine-protein kinase [Prochlorothrix hollandica]|uniref:non-specific serine/threonine protein kinase n=1 Tax=Prochlorothrix hollandica PCC 9006 = CALU 1027 TaxID=317619 RepID=A0A0M2PW14_PROHO|nr:FHA domain-containing serine/threonine-protein kinase [Prochlorothrix hollandica]KKI99287.1 hypothetical protein PROH_16310 [Prochlorothrix hollandica PCC 9006 = CALU 1027]
MVSLAFLDTPSLEPLKWWDFPTQRRIRIGRAMDNEVVIKDSLVSRYHVEIKYWDGDRSATADGSRWVIQSLGKNGTFLNHSRTEQAFLLDGDLIQLASKGPRFRFALAVVDQHSPLLVPDADAVRRLQLGSSSLGVSGDGAGRSPLPSLAEMTLGSPGGSHPRSWGRSSQGLPQSHRGPNPDRACEHLHGTAQDLFCMNCGQPLRFLSTIGRYQILKPLSRGGMGSTCVAWRQGALGSEGGGAYAFELEQRLVVLKQMNETMAKSKKARELFEREASTLKRLHHPSIPQFLDFFEENNQLYLVMEMIQGLDLKRYLRQWGVMAPSQVIDWALQVCDVLEYLHGQSPPILHRDIKPANLVLRHRDQRIVVVDFGAVKSLTSAQATRITAGGYTAPEQEEGQPRTQSDLYSLGATLIYLLTGKNPMGIHHYQQEDSAYYAQAIPSISLPLARTLSCLLQPDLQHRYPTVKEVRQALRLCKVSQPLVTV